MNALLDPAAVQIGALALLALLLLQAGGALWGVLRRRRYETLQLRAAEAVWDQRLRAAGLQAAAPERSGGGWDGFRKFEVREVVEETPEVRSFYLVPHDRKPLPPFLPGQFLTFRLHPPGHAKPVVRCYSLSDGPHPEYFRITVKRVIGPETEGARRSGIASGFLHDRVRPGDILDVRAPAGEFHPDPARDAPLVLIAGGIGITPFLALLADHAARGERREVWLFYGLRHGGEHVLPETLRGLAADHPNIHLRVAYSRPRPQDREGRDYHHRGRVDLELLRRELPSSNFEFYLCGPPAMMGSLPQQLREWGVPVKSIHSEAFGPASVPSGAAGPAPTARRITFARSGRSAEWQGGSILELAEGSGIPLESGCRAGHCGACLVAIKSGEVEYLAEPGFHAEEGSCLPCICAPRGALELDA